MLNIYFGLVLLMGLYMDYMDYIDYIDYMDYMDYMDIHV